MTCEAAKKNRKENSQGDVRFDELLRKEGIIRCPACGAAVERISGCEFMVCTSSQCQGRTYFCFECGIKLPADHAPHTCKKLLVNAPVARVRPRGGLQVRKLNKIANKVRGYLRRK
jgi:hypothetical protein